MSISTILVRDADLATAVQRNGDAAELVGSLAEVRTRLFDWEAEEATLTAMSASGMTTVPTHKAITRSDTGAVLGIVGRGYQVHGYGQWLAGNLAAIVDDSEVVVQSAGLLNGGSRAWVQITRPENSTVADFEYRPFILAGTSLDGSTATIYKRNAIAIVCQNTYAASMAGAPDLRIKHTSRSAFQLSTARDALGIMFQIEDTFGAEVEALLAHTVSEQRFEAIVTDVLGGTRPSESGRAQSLFDRKFEQITALYHNDVRVAPWRGTGLGALQAFSTYQQHVADVRGATRAERNADRLLSGVGDRFDASIRDLILS